MFSVTSENVGEVRGEGWLVFDYNGLGMFVV